VRNEPQRRHGRQLCCKSWSARNKQSVSGRQRGCERRRRRGNDNDDLRKYGRVWLVVRRRHYVSKKKNRRRQLKLRSNKLGLRRQGSEQQRRIRRVRRIWEWWLVRVWGWVVITAVSAISSVFGKRKWFRSLILCCAD